MTLIFDDEVTKNVTNKRQFSHLAKDVSAGRMLPRIGPMPLSFCHLISAIAFHFSPNRKKKNTRWMQVAILTYQCANSAKKKRNEYSLNHLFNIKSSPRNSKGLPSICMHSTYTVKPFTAQGKTARNGLKWLTITQHLSPLLRCAMNTT